MAEGSRVQRISALAVIHNKLFSFLWLDTGFQIVVIQLFHNSLNGKGFVRKPSLN